MARIAERPTDEHSIAPAQQHGGEAFAEIDGDEFERAKEDPVIKTFAARADRLFAALKRPKHLRS